MDDIIAIGDTHGRPDWKEIVNNEDFDVCVFIGDYFDTHDDVSAAQQIKNFKEIVEFKEKYPEKVILLIGNHDFHYLRGIKDNYSGYQAIHAADIQDSLHYALDKGLMQMCYLQDDIIFSHAGITTTWVENTFENDSILAFSDVVEGINELFRYKPNKFQFTPGKYNDPYGGEVCQTPIWVRPHSLAKDRLKGCRQVVGHTPHEKLKITDEGIAFIDTLGSSKEYLKVVKGEMRICTI